MSERMTALVTGGAGLIGSHIVDMALSCGWDVRVLDSLERLTHHMDGDRSDRPDELPLLLGPLLAGEADLVIGSRTLGSYEPGSLLPQQLVGNWVAARLLRWLYRVRVTDIGPFRVIRREVLLGLGMREMTYGWSVEMIARAAQRGLRVREVPVTYRIRAGGESKVSGNLRASVRAGARIIATILRCWRVAAPRAGA